MPPTWNKNPKSFFCNFLSPGLSIYLKKKNPNARESSENRFIASCFLLRLHLLAPAAAPARTSITLSALTLWPWPDWFLTTNPGRTVRVYTSAGVTKRRCSRRSGCWFVCGGFSLSWLPVVWSIRVQKEKKKKHTEEQIQEEPGTLVNVWEIEGK